MNNLKKYLNSVLTHIRNNQMPPEIRMTIHGAILCGGMFALFWFLPTVLIFLIGVAIFMFVSFVVGFLIETMYQTWKHMREDYDDQYRVD